MVVLLFSLSKEEVDLAEGWIEDVDRELLQVVVEEVDV